MKLKHIHSIPMLRLLTALCLGICLSSQFPDSNYPIIYVALGMLLVIKPLFSRTCASFNNGLAIQVLFIMVGFLLYQHHLQKHPNHYTTIASNAKLVVSIHEVHISDKMLKLSVSVEGALQNNQIIAQKSGKLLLFLKTDSINHPILNVGTQLLFHFSKLVVPPHAANPGAFDYNKYLSNKGIYHLAFLTFGDIVILKKTNPPSYQTWTNKLQHYVNTVVKKYIGIGSKAGVAEALLYGEDDLIDKTTLRDYASTGTLHVLAVSGMHVGIIFMLGGILLKPLEQTRKLRPIRNILLMLLLWSYAMVCGNSPSILRATVMFSMMLVSQIFRTGSSTLNTICASAFILIALSPSLLFDAGFLLSYAAVTGILLLHPYINKWYTPLGYLPHQIWQILSVSIAAQIGTLPLGLFYFHQFPLLFIPANLIIIPISTVILYGSLFLVFIAPFNTLAQLVGNLIGFLIELMNSIAHFLGNLSFSVWEGFYPSAWMIPYGYLLMIVCIVFIKYRSRLIFTLFIFLLTPVIFRNGFHKIKSTTSQEIILFKDNKNLCLWLRYGQHVKAFVESNETPTHPSIHAVTSPYLYMNQIQSVKYTLLDSNWHLINFFNKQILITGKGKTHKKYLNVDLCILRPYTNGPYENSIRTKTTVVVSKSTCAYSILKSFSDSVHFTSRSGAFKLTLNHDEQSGDL